jgi:hypothetical protein
MNHWRSRRGWSRGRETHRLPQSTSTRRAYLLSTVLILALATIWLLASCATRAAPVPPIAGPSRHLRSLSGGETVYQ